MAYRHSTPPAAITIDAYDDMYYPGGSASTTATSVYFPNDWSPEQVLTATTTPDTTPPRVHYDISGPWLLPRPREQDQPSVSYAVRSPSFHGGHSRTFSCPSNALQSHFRDFLAPPSECRRSVSPPEYRPSCSPASPYEPPPTETSSTQPSFEYYRPQSFSHARSHSRSTSSSSSVDATQIMRHGYPYRSSPAPQSTGMALPRVPTAMSHLAPISTMPGGQIQSWPSHRRASGAPAKPPRLSIRTEFQAEPEVRMTSLLDYLTEPNPTLAIVHSSTEPSHIQNTHFWFDVRNIKPWTDFNIATISSMPRLLDLLNIPLPASTLPVTVRHNQPPQSVSQLAEVCARHHGVKVNAALKIAQGEDKHIAISALTCATPSSRQQPQFVANYKCSSGEQANVYGTGRGRVVGIVRSFNQWNSSLISGNNIEKVQYLKHLAHLHRFMRENETRYGFIMTEVELVCVRAGGPPSAHSYDSSSTTSSPPLFGFLEIAPAVQASASGRSDNGINSSTKLRMTVSLALWYLHMLAKEQPFPGQMHWRMDVGPPSAVSRQHHLSRDSSLPKPNINEKREAKRVRGWVYPDEGFSRREVGRGRRNGTSSATVEKVKAKERRARERD